MQRWYPDRIGGMFTANAEAVADRALQQPSVGMAEVNFYCDGIFSGTPSRIDLGQGRIDGWSKPESAHLAGKQLFLGIVATTLGAPSAPYLHVRGINCLFSPACVPHPRRVKGILGTEDPISLGAACQWRAWVNDADWYSQNSSGCERTNGFYLYDHEYADPCTDRLQPKTALFIEEAVAAQTGHFAAQDFVRGEVMMAARIRSVDTQLLQTAAQRVTDANLIVTERFVGGLATRARLFDQPVRPQNPVGNLPAAQRLQRA